MAEIQKCRSCGQQIIWAETEKGRRMPIDAKPSVDGNIVLKVRGAYIAPLAIVRFAVPLNVTADQRYKSHFATCPNAAKHRKVAH